MSLLFTNAQKHGTLLKFSSERDISSGHIVTSLCWKCN